MYKNTVLVMQWRTPRRQSKKDDNGDGTNAEGVGVMSGRLEATSRKQKRDGGWSEAGDEKKWQGNGGFDATKRSI